MKDTDEEEEIKQKKMVIRYFKKSDENSGNFMKKSYNLLFDCWESEREKEK